jgi:TP901 family phage tail tape measure protein
MYIIDSINNVANNEPIDTAGIGEALQRSAAAFNAANTDLQESIALVTSTNSVLQSPDKVGSMWTTVSARIRGATTELEEAGEDTDGMVESTSKLQALIKGMTGFDILEEDGKTFKSIYDIIIGIGEEFQNLDDIDQASLLEALAGETLNCLKIWKHILKNIFNCKENLKLYATI